MASEKPERGWIPKDKYKDNKDGMDGTQKGIKEMREANRQEGFMGK